MEAQPQPQWASLLISMGRTIIGDYIRARREELGLNLGTLASRAGVATSTVSQIETGQRVRPAPRTLGLLAQALGVPHSRLLELAGHVSPGTPGPEHLDLDPALRPILLELPEHLTAEELEALRLTVDVIRERRRRRRAGER